MDSREKSVEHKFMIEKYIGIVDEPNPKGSKDTLDIYRHADALTEFIRKTSTPMAIGIQGEWGSGKTSLLNAIYYALEKEGGKFLQIWVNSWEHSLLTTPEETLLKIINAIIHEMVLGDDNKARQSNIMESTGNLIKGALRIGATVVGGSKGLEVADEMLRTNVNSIKELREQLVSLAEEIQARNTNPAEKIIIYVDDLDRIEPKEAVLVLELLKNIFSIPNCVFLLAIDYQVIVKGLEHKFGKRTEENEWEFRAFFDKIIQLPFMMPMGQYNKGKYVSNLLYQIGFIEYKEKFVASLDRVLVYTIGGNPRSLKRLVNSLALINIFAGIEEDKDISETNYGVTEDVKDMVLFSLVCLQISFPAIYELLVSNPDFPKWDIDTAFEVTKKSEEKDKETFERDFEIVAGKEDFDEEWEKALFRICYVRPRYRSRVADISKFFSYIKDELLKDQQEEINVIIAKIISDTAVTNVSTSDEQQKQNQKPYQRTMYSGFDEWKQTQTDNAPKNQAAKDKFLEELNIIQFLHESVSNSFQQNNDFEIKYSKTGGCTGYAQGRKFLAIGYKGSKMGAVIEILKDYEVEYRIPNIKHFITEHIREYKVGQPGTANFGERFRIRPLQDNAFTPREIFKDNIEILLKLINRSYDLATIYKDKIMVVYKSDGTDGQCSQEELERQKMYLDPNYRYNY
ncbi:uncharacterized protein METZ01_LOCUS157023 [marine metagenome]|uniref:KAP NTPase domain-containing protein n=1 Tax=marine metagenome TaxID=408172 RepID=A0A382ARX5_9ZZZZ